MYIRYIPVDITAPRTLVISYTACITIRGAGISTGIYTSRYTRPTDLGNILYSMYLLYIPVDITAPRTLVISYTACILPRSVGRLYLLVYIIYTCSRYTRPTDLGNILYSMYILYIHAVDITAPRTLVISYTACIYNIYQ